MKDSQWIITYQSSLPSTLNAVQPEKEWRRSFALILELLSMLFQPFEDEWYAMLGLVVYYLGHADAHVFSVRDVWRKASLSHAVPTNTRPRTDQVRYMYFDMDHTRQRDSSALFLSVQAIKARPQEEIFVLGITFGIVNYNYQLFVVDIS